MSKISRRKALLSSMMPTDGHARGPLLSDDFGMSRFRGR